MEILLELVLGILFEAIGALIEGLFMSLVDTVMNSSKALKVTKYIIGSLLLMGLIAICTYGLIKKQEPIIIASISYILTAGVLRAVLFYFKETKFKAIKIIIRWVLRIVNYSFCIVLIVLTTIYVNTTIAKVVIIVLTSIAIVILFFVDLYRIEVYEKRKEKQREEQRRKEEENRRFEIDESDYYIEDYSEEE